MGDQITGKIGSYTVTLTPPIGRGAFGTVHRAVQDRTNTVFAAKQIIIGEQGRINQEMRQMASSEIKIMQDLQNHPNIVKVHEHLIKENVCWLFIEYCDRNNLSTYLRDNRKLPMFSRLKILYQSASAVAYMHKQKPPVIHRDIKLENIMMKRERGEDIAKLTDFGVSKLCPEQQSLSQNFKRGPMMTTTCGSQYFMAPEFYAELEGGTQYDSSVDVFSLGLVFVVVFDQQSMPDLIPLSVSARKAKKDVSFGQEMIHCFRNKKRMPQLFERTGTPCLTSQRVMRVVENMTRFSSRERKNIDEVEAEMQEMLDQMDEEREHQHQLTALQKELKEQKDSLRLTPRPSRAAAEAEPSLEHMSVKNLAVDTAEEYRELMASEWISAMEQLVQIGGSTPKSHRLLHALLMAAESRASEHYSAAVRTLEAPLGLQKTATAGGDSAEVSQGTLKAVRGHWRTTANHADVTKLTREVETEIMKTEFAGIYSSAKDKSNIKSFVRKSAMIAWKMTLQRPKMHFRSIQTGSRYDKKMAEVCFGSEDPSKNPVLYTVGPALYHGDQLMVKAKIMCG